MKRKTALVTGSSRGLGAGVAIRLAEAGANLAIHGSGGVPKVTQQKLRAVGADPFAVVGDVSDGSVCLRLMEQGVHHFGAIDVPVNHAGIIRRAPAIEQSDEDWQAVIDTNLTSVFRLTKHAGKHVLARCFGQGRSYCFALNISGRGFVSSYAAAKGGVGHLNEGIRQ